MLRGIDSSLSALRAFSKSLAVVSHNLANSHTNGYKKSRAILEEGQNGDVSVSIRTIDTPGTPVSYEHAESCDNEMQETSNVDLAEETVEMIKDQRGYEASLEFVSSRIEMERALLDIIA